MTPSWPVLLFTLGVAVVTGILFGIAPAWMTLHAEPIEALRGSRGSTGTKARWPQRVLVIAQAAMSLVLLSAAAMLGQSLRNLEHQNYGFKMKGRYVAWIDPQLANYKPEQLNTLYREMLEKLGAIPGVRRVSACLYAPMSGDSWNTGVDIEGKPEPRRGRLRRDVGTGDARVLRDGGQSHADGRPITEDDTASTRRVAVINEAFAQRFFKGENPIGKHFGPDKAQYADWWEIVGVAKTMRYNSYGMDKPAGRCTSWPRRRRSVSAGGYGGRDLVAVPL